MIQKILDDFRNRHVHRTETALDYDIRWLKKRLTQLVESVPDKPLYTKGLDGDITLMGEIFLKEIKEWKQKQLGKEDSKTKLCRTCEKKKQIGETACSKCGDYSYIKH